MKFSRFFPSVLQRWTHPSVSSGRRDRSDGTDEEMPVVSELEGDHQYEHAERPFQIGPSLDAFLSSVYQFYDENGLFCVIFDRVLHILNLVFVMTFMIFLVYFVNWHDLYHCEAPGSVSANGTVPPLICRDVSVVSVPTSASDALSSVPRVLVLFVELSWLLFLLQNIRVSIVHISAAVRMSRLFGLMGFRGDTLTSTRWDDIVVHLGRMNRQRRLSAVVPFDALSIANRILRVENVIIALVNTDRIVVPSFCCSSVFFWWLQHLVQLHFDSNARIIPRRAEFLRHWFLLYGVVAALVSPFVLPYVVVTFAFRHAPEMRSAPSRFGVRTFSTLARWQMRQINELDHVFRGRLRKCHAAAVHYVGGFPSPLKEVIAAHALGVLGGFICIVILIGLLNYEALVGLRVFDQNLLWWLSLLLVVFAFVLSFRNSDAEQPVPDAPGAFFSETGAFEAEKSLKQFASVATYSRKAWRGNAHTTAVHAELRDIFPLRVWHLLVELLGPITAPFVLLRYMPACASGLEAFFSTLVVPLGADGDHGDVVAYATFDTSRFGNPKYGATRTDSQADQPGRSRSRHGKMEKSLIAFAAVHPSWQPPPVIADYLTSIGTSLASHVSATAALHESGSMLLSRQHMANTDLPARPRHDAAVRFAPTSAALAGLAQVPDVGVDTPGESYQAGVLPPILPGAAPKVLDDDDNFAVPRAALQQDGSSRRPSSLPRSAGSRTSTPPRLTPRLTPQESMPTVSALFTGVGLSSMATPSVMSALDEVHRASPKTG